MSNVKNTSGWLGADVVNLVRYGADAVMARPRQGLIVVFGDLAIGDVTGTPRSGVQHLA